MLTKSAIEVVWPPLEAGRGEEWILSCSLQKESSTDEAISDFWPPELQENKFPLLHQVCGHVSQQQQKNEGTFEAS